MLLAGLAPLAGALPFATGAAAGAAGPPPGARREESALGQSAATWALAREGYLVNHKGVERLMREEHLLVRQRRRRKRAAMVRVPTPIPQRTDERWSMDFVRDTLVDGRPFRVWTVIDDATRECPMLLVERSLPAGRITDALETLRLVRGLPQTLVCDNGPEFVSQAMGRAPGLHSSRAAGGELFHRELQRVPAGRVPKRASLRHTGGGTHGDRGLEARVQHSAAAQQPGTTDPHRVCSMAGSGRTEGNTHDFTILSGPQLGETSVLKGMLRDG